MLNAFIISLITLSIILISTIVIFGSLEKIIERMPKVYNFLENMFDTED